MLTFSVTQVSVLQISNFSTDRLKGFTEPSNFHINRLQVLCDQEKKCYRTEYNVYISA